MSHCGGSSDGCKTKNVIYTRRTLSSYRSGRSIRIWTGLWFAGKLVCKENIDIIIDIIFIMKCCQRHCISNYAALIKDG